MSNLINFEELGGYRLEQPTFEKMQSTYYLFLKALIGHFGIPDIGSFIISGCEIDGDNITPGIVYINGTICEFAGSAGTLATLIKKTVTTETLEFFNGTTKAVFQKFTATVDAAGTALSEFVRVPSPFNLPVGTVIDPNYVATENNFSDAWIEFLMSIEFGAEKNVQTDWNQSNPEADDFLKNRPQGNLLTWLHKGTVIIGNITNSQVLTVDGFDVGTNNYMVVPGLRGYSSVADRDNDVTFNTFDHTPTSFKLTLDQHSDQEQNVRFNFILIPL